MFYLTDSLDIRVAGRETSEKESYLGLNVKNTALALFLDLADSSEAGAVEVVRKLGMLDEGAVCEEILELVAGDKVIVGSVDLARPGCASGI